MEMANTGKGRVPDVDPKNAGFPAKDGKGKSGPKRGNNHPKSAPKKGSNSGAKDGQKPSFFYRSNLKKN